MEKTKMLKILATGAALSFLVASSAVAQTRFPCAAAVPHRAMIRDSSVKPFRARHMADVDSWFLEVRLARP